MKKKNPPVMTSTSEFEKASAARAGDGAKIAGYVLRLYVAGINKKSATVIRSITAICEHHLKGRYDLEVMDMYQKPTLAAQ